MPGRLSDSDTGTPRPGSPARNATEHRAAAEPVPRGTMAAMTRTRNYIAVYERDPESDAWLVHIQGIAGCHTYGRTLRQAETRIREALAAWLERDPGGLEIASEWPPELENVATKVSQARPMPPSQRKRPERRRPRLRSGSSAWVSAAETPPTSSASPTSACSSCSPRSHSASHARPGPVRLTGGALRSRVPSLGTRTPAWVRPLGHGEGT